MAKAFTPRQGQFLAYIQGYIVRHGIAPSFEDMAQHFGISTPSVNGMIKTLESRGFLTRIPGVSRSLRVLVPSSELPDGEFGARSTRSKPAPARAAPAPVSEIDAAVTAALSTLDLLMSRVPEGEDGPRIVVAAAAAVRQSLLTLGLEEQAALEVYRRIEAEAARWVSGGRGIRVSHQV